MNAPSEISIREALRPEDLPAVSPSLVFTGTRGELAAYLIEKDSVYWNCLEYIIHDHRPARYPDTRHWCIWRR